MTTASNNTYVYVGAEASGLYRLSPNSSEWEELTIGLPANPVVPGVAIHPDKPEVVYAGAQDGPYRSPMVSSSNPVIEEYRFDLEEADQATETLRH